MYSENEFIVDQIGCVCPSVWLTLFTFSKYTFVLQKHFNIIFTNIARYRSVLFLPFEGNYHVGNAIKTFFYVF